MLFNVAATTAVIKGVTSLRIMTLCVMKWQRDFLAHVLVQHAIQKKSAHITLSVGYGPQDRRPWFDSHKRQMFLNVQTGSGPTEITI